MSALGQKQTAAHLSVSFTPDSDMDCVFQLRVIVDVFAAQSHIRLPSKATLGGGLSNV